MSDPKQMSIAPSQERAVQRLPSARIRRAVYLMVWEGHDRRQAAKATGMLDKSLYNSFREHHVKQYYLAELGALRMSSRAKSFHRLEAIAAQDENKMAAVTAIKAMEQLADVSEASSPASRTMPGITIIVGEDPRRRPIIDITPDAECGEG